MTTPTKKEIESVQQTLRVLRDPLKLLDTSWMKSCLVIQRLPRYPDLPPHHALIEVFSEVLESLNAEAPDHADILRGRFWEELSVNQMVLAGRPKVQSESAFFIAQREAIHRFTLLVLAKERACQQALLPPPPDIPGIPHESEPLPDEPEPPTLPPAPRSRSRLPLGLALLLVVALLVGWAMREPSEPPSPPTYTPTVPTLTACGETERVTIEGISRFVRQQGVSVFSPANSDGAILNERVRAITINESGLWAGYHATEQNSATGATHYDKLSWATCAAPPGNINAITSDQLGRIWVAYEKQGVAMLDNEGWHTFTRQDGLPSDETYSITVDQDNHIWVATWEGVAKFDGTTWSVPYTAQDNILFNNRVHAIAFDSQGNVWVGHVGDGISQFSLAERKWIHHTIETGMSGDQVRDILVRPADEQMPESVWVATEDGGISVFVEGEWQQHTVKEGVPSPIVADLALDRHGRVWAATRAGVVFFAGDAWQSYNQIPSLSLAFGPACQECPFDEEHVWVGSYEQGLTHSRLPYPDVALTITQVCFHVEGQPLVCETPPEPVGEVITVTYPTPLTSGEAVRLEFTVSPQAPYQLREDRGDFLSNLAESDEVLYGTYPIIPVKGAIESGQSFTLTDFDNPFIAPDLLPDQTHRTIVSPWRMWMHTRYTGPLLRLEFTIE